MRKVLIGLVAGLFLSGGVSVSPAIAQHTTKTPKASPAAAAPANTSTAPANTSATPAKASAGFATEAAAKAHCPSDTVMWANHGSKVLHYAGSKYYGKTKQGSYMCEGEATKLGYHAAKGEKKQS